MNDVLESPLETFGTRPDEVKIRSRRCLTKSQKVVEIDGPHTDPRIPMTSPQYSCNVPHLTETRSIPAVLRLKTQMSFIETT